MGLFRPASDIRTAPSAPSSSQAVTVAQMQAIDDTAIRQFGIPRLLLMEHAGLALASAVAAMSRPSSAPVLVACGSGYNGGDGLCAGRHLHALGYGVRVVLVGRLAALRDEPAQYARMLQRLGIEIREIQRADEIDASAPWIVEAPCVVDALLGIGIRGTVREPYAALIARLNASGRPIVSADVPSGLDADTGVVQGVAVKAACTVTFGRPKRGCFMAEGPAHAGRLIIDQITIPPQILEKV